MTHPSLYIGDADKMGRGVFSKTVIPPETIIEESPVIVMTAEERKLLDQTKLHDYIFEWGEKKDHCCMALGYIAVYNHSYLSNCEYEMDYEKEIISIKTVRPINPGEQLFINYNGDWDDGTVLWFDAY